MVVVVECARLVAPAQVVVERPSHLMLDLVAQPDQEAKVVGGVLVDGRSTLVDAAFEFPVFIGAMLRPIEMPALALLGVVAVLDALAPIVRMQQVRPGNDHEDDERLRLEGDVRVIEHPDSAQSRFTRLRQEFQRERANGAVACSHRVGIAISISSASALRRPHIHR